MNLIKFIYNKNTWNNLLYERDALDFINDPEAYYAGLGYEECNDIMNHNSKSYDEEGNPLATAATSLDFVGNGVVASGTGAGKTITITDTIVTDFVSAASGGAFAGAINITDTTAPLVLKYDAQEYVTHAVSSAGVYSITTADDSSDSGQIKLDAPLGVEVAGDLTITGTGVGQMEVDHRKFDISTSATSWDAAGKGAGDVIYGPTTTGLTPGLIYYLSPSTDEWVLTNADTPADSNGFLAVALGSAASDGMLLRGMVHVDVNSNLGTDTGVHLYLSTQTDGGLKTQPPGSSGNIVRVVGYTINASEHQIYFNPDNTFIEID